MTDTFQVRLRAAAGAAWWTVLVWWLLLLVSSVGSAVMLHYRPQCVLNTMGGDVTWAEIRNLYLWFIGGFKVLGIVATLLALFLSIWNRRLKRLMRHSQP